MIQHTKYNTIVHRRNILTARTLCAGLVGTLDGTLGFFGLMAVTMVGLMALFRSCTALLPKPVRDGFVEIFIGASLFISCDKMYEVSYERTHRACCTFSRHFAKYIQEAFGRMNYGSLQTAKRGTPDKEQSLTLSCGWRW